MELDDLYQEVILDHFKKPRCHGALEKATATSGLFNPLCGDKITLSLQIEGDRVTAVRFTGNGCSISQASASIVSELCENKTIDEVRQLCVSFKSMMRGEKKEDDLIELGDAVALAGVRNFSARVKCATLAWEAIEKCLDQAAASS